MEDVNIVIHRVHSDFWTTKTEKYDFGFAWADGPGVEETGRKVVLVQAILRKPMPGPLDVLSIRMMNELAKLGIIEPQGTQRTQRWMVRHGIVSEQVARVDEKEVSQRYAAIKQRFGLD